jgi:WD40 repeat protein
LGHTLSVASAVFSADGKRVISGSDDGSLRIWDAQTGMPARKIFAGHNAVCSVAVSNDGTHIAAGSTDNTIKIWNVDTGKQVGNPLQGHTGDVASVVFSPDGKHIVSGSADATIVIWDAETGEQLRTLQGHGSLVRSVTTDGKYIVSGSNDSTVRIWHFETGKQVGEPLMGHEYGVNSVAISNSKGWVIFGSNGGPVQVWDMETRSLIKQLDVQDIVLSVAVSDVGNKIAAGTSETVLIWDMEAIDAKPVALAGHGRTVGRIIDRRNVYSVAFSRDGRFLVSGSWDKKIKVWDVHAGKEVDYYDCMFS